MRRADSERINMNRNRNIRRPLLAPGARYRFDELRRQHQLLFPEGVLILNETGAAIVQICDGRAKNELLADLEDRFSEVGLANDLDEFLQRLARKGLLRDADDA